MLYLGFLEHYQNPSPVGADLDPSFELLLFLLTKWLPPLDSRRQCAEHLSVFIHDSHYMEAALDLCTRRPSLPVIWSVYLFFSSRLTDGGILFVRHVFSRGDWHVGKRLQARCVWSLFAGSHVRNLTAVYCSAWSWSWVSASFCNSFVEMRSVLWLFFPFRVSLITCDLNLKQFLHFFLQSIWICVLSKLFLESV